MKELPVFDEIHVVSDIHMGGKPGFQILRESKRLANHICWVSTHRPGANIALILNGDVIDTLAEDVAGYIAFDEAVSTVSRIMGDASFSPIWDALAGFVRIDNCTLIFVIGNHDIEIAFPNVQRLIIERLSGGDDPAKARIEFSAAGAGYGCMVGKTRLFCTHGNEVDPWNFSRYEDLSRVCRRLNAGLSLSRSEWTPNAGTRLVKDVMNDIKKKYAWIDLLKPESSAAIGTLLTLDPSQLGKINKLLPILGEKITGSEQVDARLSADSLQLPISDDNAPLALESILGRNILDSMSEHAGMANGRCGDDMLLALEKKRALKTSGPTVSIADAPLGVGQLVWDRLTGWLTGVSRDEALRRALQDWLKGDATFSLNEKDDTYKEITSKLGVSIDIVITGHTHLARAINMGAGRYYFNCGTWIRLMRFTDAMLKDSTLFKPVYDLLESGRMDALDAAAFNGEPLLFDQTTSVSVCLEEGKTIARLNRITGDGTQTPLALTSFERA